MHVISDCYVTLWLTEREWQGKNNFKLVTRWQRQKENDCFFCHSVVACFKKKEKKTIAFCKWQTITQRCFFALLLQANGICVMPRAGRCQTSFRWWNATVFGASVILEPLTSYLLKEWKLSALHQIKASRLLFSQLKYCWRLQQHHLWTRFSRSV